MLLFICFPVLILSSVVVPPDYWSEFSSVTPSVVIGSSQFGSVVSFSSDGSLLAVGAPLENSTAGWVYLYRPDAVLGWKSPTVVWIFRGGVAAAQFGSSVALSGNAVLAVGAFGEKAAYVFVESGGVWSEQARLTSPSPSSSVAFGWGVGLFGTTLVVSDCYDSLDGTQSGRAFVYRQSGSSWSFLTDLRASNAQADTWFGWSVAISQNNIVIGAP